MHSVPAILSPLSQQEYIYCSVEGEARLPSVTGTAQMQEGDQYNSAGVTALRIRLSLRSPGPFSTHHMLPWHPNTSLTTTQPFPTQILFSQPAPNTPLFAFPQWATQTRASGHRAPVAVNHALRKRAESSKKPSSSFWKIQSSCGLEQHGGEHSEGICVFISRSHKRSQKSCLQPDKHTAVAFQHSQRRASTSPKDDSRLRHSQGTHGDAIGSVTL